MTKCNPYHTTNEEKPKQRDVYHNYKECPDGMRIKPENKKDGTASPFINEACLMSSVSLGSQLSELSDRRSRRFADDDGCRDRQERG